MNLDISVPRLRALVDQRRLAQDVADLSSAPRNRSAPDRMTEVRRFLTGRLTDLGWIVEAEAFRLHARWGSPDRHARAPLRRIPLRIHPRLDGVNLVARHPSVGTDARSPLLIAAHYDTVSVSPGADDNASGVAAVLEIARLLADDPTPVTLALFDLEETGRWGAKAFVDAHSSDLPRAMICLESVGYFDDAPGSQRVPPGFGLLGGASVAQVRDGGSRGDFVLAVHRRSSAALARTWCAAAGQAGVTGHALRDPRPDGRFGALGSMIAPPLISLDRSDHAPFWRAGVPAVLLTDTANLRNPHYHRPTDVPATLDITRLAAVAAATAATALVAPIGHDGGPTAGTSPTAGTDSVGPTS